MTEEENKSKYSCIIKTPEGKEKIEIEDGEEVEIMGGRGRLEAEEGDLMYSSNDGEPVTARYLDAPTRGLNDCRGKRFPVNDDELYRIDVDKEYSLEPVRN
ncbi:MAG: hypothetical protein ACLFQ8_00910 [Candidatus Aenigmatarchaeota archaeon]